MARHGRSFLFRAVVHNPFRLAAEAGANAAGATVTLNTSLIAGTATGASSAAAVTVSEATALVSGAATGAASAAAATVTEQQSLSTAGAATGAATRAGATVSLNTSLIAGAQSGAAFAAGSTVSDAFTLTAGAASGGGAGVASGATVTEQLSLVAARTFPNASTTGPRFSFTGTSGPITVSTNGAVVERLDFTGDIVIDANNVTVRDCRIQSFPFFGVRVLDGFTGSVVEYNEIIGGDNGIAGADATFRYNNIHGNADGLKMWGNNVVEYNYIHDLGTGDPGEHNDGIQTTGGGPYTVRGNTVINQNSQTSCLLLGEEAGPITSTLVEGNYFAGGGYAIYSAAGATIRDNVIGTGAFSWATGTAPSGGWTNNIDAASGRYVAFDGTLGSLAPTAGEATGAALATGATVTEATSLIAGSASVAGTGTASGVTVSLAASLIAGTATGAATRAGATVTEAASLVAGTAVAGSGAPAATVTQTRSLITGAATGAALAPLLRTFDQLDDTWDSTGITLDDASGSIIGGESFALVSGAAIISSAAPGATLTETAALLAGTAVGNTAPVVAGATVTAVTSLIAGSTSSSQPAMVTGTTVSVVSSLTAGAATGAAVARTAVTFDQTAPTSWDATSPTFDNAGALFVGLPSYTFIAGAAVGISVAAGVTFQTSASFIASPANVTLQPATAQGATLTVAVSFEPGTARGVGWTPLPEGAPTWTKVATPGDGWTVVPPPGGIWDKAA